MTTITKTLPDSGYTVEIRFSNRFDWEHIEKNGPVVDVKSTPGTWYVKGLLGYDRYNQRGLRRGDTLSLDQGAGWSLSAQDTEAIRLWSVAAWTLWS